MTTVWTRPNTINQFAEFEGEEAHVSWNNLDHLINPGKNTTQTQKSLFHIARSPKHDIKDQTFYITASNFKFKNLPNSISGIGVRLHCSRFGRVTDDTIQLYLNNQFIGENKATLEIKDEQLYGGTSDLWGTTNLSLVDLQDPSFGITLRFKAHPKWPHKSSVIIYAVEMQIY